MRTAVIGSQYCTLPNIGSFLPPDTTALISSGAPGVDLLAEEWADARQLPKLILRHEDFPDPAVYGRSVAGVSETIVVALGPYTDRVAAVVERAKSKGCRLRFILVP